MIKPLMPAVLIAMLACASASRPEAPARQAVEKPTARARKAAAVQEKTTARSQAQAPVKPTQQDETKGGIEIGNPFPPTLPDTEWHQDAWIKNDCLRCHETGVGDAPRVIHKGMGLVLLSAKCRSCHVLIPGSKPRGAKKLQKIESIFAPNAFPPMIPASSSHRFAWIKDDCRLCHELGISGAPAIVHKGMPAILLSAKCRSCHVQIRAVQASSPALKRFR